MGFRVLIDSLSDERDKFSYDPDFSDEDTAVKWAFERIGVTRAPTGDYHVTVWPIDERGTPTGPVVRFTCTMSRVQVVKHHSPDRAALVAAGLAVPDDCSRPSLAPDEVQSENPVARYVRLTGEMRRAFSAGDSTEGIRLSSERDVVLEAMTGEQKRSANDKLVAVGLWVDSPEAGEG